MIPRRVLRKLLRPSALAALWLGGVLILTPGAHASILGGDYAVAPSDAFCVEKFEETFARLAGTDTGGQTTAPEASATGERTIPPTPLGEEQNDEPQDNSYLYQGSGTPGSSTSSTSSVGATGPGGGPALLTAAAVHLADDSPARRFASEQKLMLPAAPGTELLRPPQG